MIDFKSCPSCGSQDLNLSDTTVYHYKNGVCISWGLGFVTVECRKCGIFAKGKTTVEAVEKWNNLAANDRT